MFLRPPIAIFTIVVLLLVTVGIGTGAPSAGRVWRIGYLDQGSTARNTLYLDGLRQGLRELGWVEGQNITIEPRFAEGKTERLPALVDDGDRVPRLHQVQRQRGANPPASDHDDNVPSTNKRPRPASWRNSPDNHRDTT